MLRMRLRGGTPETYISNIDIADAQHFGSAPDKSDLLCRGLSLLGIAANDAGISAEVDESPGLSAANRAGTARDEHDSVSCGCLSVGISRTSIPHRYSPKMPSTHAELKYSDFGTTMVLNMFCLPGGVGVLSFGQVSSKLRQESQK